MGACGFAKTFQRIVEKRIDRAPQKFVDVKKVSFLDLAFGQPIHILGLAGTQFSLQTQAVAGDLGPHMGITPERPVAAKLYLVPGEFGRKNSAARPITSLQDQGAEARAV